MSILNTFPRGTCVRVVGRDDKKKLSTLQVLCLFSHTHTHTRGAQFSSFERVVSACVPVAGRTCMCAHTHIHWLEYEQYPNMYVFHLTTHPPTQTMRPHNYICKSRRFEIVLLILNSRRFAPSPLRLQYITIYLFFVCRMRWI